MKKCTKCNKDLPLNSFAFRNVKKGQRQPQCKECHKSYSKKHYESKTSYYIKKARKRNVQTYQDNRERVDEFKMSSGCLYCAEKDPCCLDFHHQSNDKKYSISNKLADKTWTALLEEIKKCIVVCANCHRKLHAGKISIKINI